MHFCGAENGDGLKLAFLNCAKLITSRPLSNKKRTHPCARAAHDPPPDAYITLGGQGQTQMCRLITALSPFSFSRNQSFLPPDSLQVTRAIDALVEAGLQTFDVGCIHPQSQYQQYRDVALLAREYIRLVGPSLASTLRFCTQVEINPHIMNEIHFHSVQSIVDQHLTKTGLERLDLFQLAWSDFRDRRYVEFLGELLELRRVGKVASVGTIDFPTHELKYLASQGISIASNQVPFSLVDRRASSDMAAWCRSNSIGLLTNSALGAGFICERFLGLPEPSKRLFDSPQVARFASVIRAWGGWSLFQELLYAVKQVADKHNVSMPNVAIKWALQSTGLTAVIVDTSLSDIPEIQRCISNLRVFHFILDEDDCLLLDSIVEKCNDLHSILGDCGYELQPRSR